MARKRNSKKRRNAKPVEIREMIVKDLMPEITKDTVDMEPVEETASVISPIEAAAEEVNSETLAEPITSSESEISIEQVTPAEPAAAFKPVTDDEPAAAFKPVASDEPTTAIDPVATAEFTESIESVTPAVSEQTESEMTAEPINSADLLAPVTDELEITEPPKDEITDFTLVMDPADVNKQAEADAENAVNMNPENANAENAQLEADYAAARATGPAKSTAITPIIPVTGYGDAQSNMSQNHESDANVLQDHSSHANNAKGKSSKAGHFKAAASHNADKVKGIFDKPVTRKFLAAALGLTLVLNGAIAAGIMSLYSHGIKKDVSAVRETVSELESRSGNSGDFGNGGPGMGMTPPDMNNDGSWGDSWGSGDNYYGGENGYNGGDSWGSDDSWNNDGNDLGREDSDYGEYWDNDWDDDLDDDDWSGESAPYAGNDQGQASNSGVSIGIVISDNNGVYVTQVTGSNAQKAGFQAGDKIVSFDGDDISSSNELIEEVQEHKSGDTVKVVVERNGKQVKIKTVLE